MGYAQTTTGVTATGPLTPLIFTAPICAQYAVQVGGSGSGSATLYVSLDGVNFITSGLAAGAGQIAGGPSPQNLKPIAAIQANVTSVTGSIDVTITAAPLNSE